MAELSTIGLLFYAFSNMKSQSNYFPDFSDMESRGYYFCLLLLTISYIKLTAVKTDRTVPTTQ